MTARTLRAAPAAPSLVLPAPADAAAGAVLNPCPQPYAAPGEAAGVTGVVPTDADHSTRDTSAVVVSVGARVEGAGAVVLHSAAESPAAPVMNPDALDAVVHTSAPAPLQPTSHRHLVADVDSPAGQGSALSLPPVASPAIDLR